MSDVVSEVGSALFHSGCLKFGSFKIKSGAVSPYYVDLSHLLSSPKDFCCVVDEVAEEVKRVSSHTIDKLASIELKGALLLPSIACRLKLPCIVVRKTEKKHGFTGRIAGGTVAKEEHILFFDDVVTDGMSKVEGIKPLEELGGQVDLVMVVVDREQGGRQNIERSGYKFHALATISELVKCLFKSSHISEEQVNVVLDYVERSKN